MLTIEFWNLTAPTKDVADYEVRVRDDGKLIAKHVVRDCPRVDGWRGLVRRLGAEPSDEQA